MKALIKKSTGEWINIDVDEGRLWISSYPRIVPDKLIENFKSSNRHLDFTDIDLVEVVVIRKDMVPSDEDMQKAVCQHNIDAPVSGRSCSFCEGAKWMRDKLLGQHTDNQEAKPMPENYCKYCGKAPCEREGMSWPGEEEDEPDNQEGEG